MKTIRIIPDGTTQTRRMWRLRLPKGVAAASSPSRAKKGTQVLPQGIELAFCPTGPGGGVDPTCSPGGASSSGGSVKIKELDLKIASIVKLREEAKAGVKKAKESGDKKALSHWRKVRKQANKELDALQKEKISHGGKAEFKTYQKGKYSSDQIVKLTGAAKIKAISENAAATPTVSGEAAKTVFDAKGRVVSSCCIDPAMHPTTASNDQVFNQYKGFNKKLDYEELQAIRMYSGSSYGSINSTLRKSGGEKNTDLGQKLDRTFKKALPLEKDIVVRRGTTEASGVFDKLQTGDVFIDHGFVSTSAAPSGGFGGKNSFQIRVPKGSRGIYMDSTLSTHSSEREYLLPRGAKFRVTGVLFKPNKQGGGVKQIQMEYLGSG